MKNFVQDGDVVTVAAPYALSSGQGALVGSLFGVATNGAASGASVELIIEGVVTLAALGTDTASVGAKAYWDNTNRRVTTTATSNSLIGVFLAAKASGDATATLRLNGVSV